MRTMSCLDVEEIMQFLYDPLEDALNDKDPYVRKTGDVSLKYMTSILNLKRINLDL